MDKIYEITVSNKFTGGDLMEIVQKKFSIPEDFELTGKPVDKNTFAKVKVKNFLFSNENEILEFKSLEECSIKQNDIISLCFDLEIEQDSFLDIKSNGHFRTTLSFEKTIVANIKSLEKFFLKKAEVEITKLLNKDSN